MKLVDTNVWLALALSAHEFHEICVEWLSAEKSSDQIVFCRSTQQSFLRLLTTAAMLQRFGNPPLTSSQAWQVYQGFLADPRIAFAQEPDGLEGEWIRLAELDLPSPKVWMDAYLAAFAIAGGYHLITTDKAFLQFKGLSVELMGAD